MKLLVFAHTPPPHHGQSYMVQLMLERFGGDRRKRPAQGNESDLGIECYHVNARVSQHLEDIGDIRVGKFLLLLGYCLQAIWCRFRYGVTNFYYIPAPGKASALYRDFLVLFLCRPFFKRLILHWHASGLARWLEATARPRWRALTYGVTKQADLSIVLSDYGKADAEKLYPLRIAILGNGIPDPCPAFRAEVLPVRRARLEARLALLEQKPIPAAVLPAAGPDPAVFTALFLGHCTREKGLFDAIQGALLAHRELSARKSRVSLRLIVAGTFMSAAEEQEFREILKNEGAGTLEYVGFIEGAAKRSWLQRADGFCFPSHIESFGLVLVEALAYGLPIVTARAGAVPEVVGNDYPGLVDVRRPDKIADALLLLLTSNCFGEARERFELNFQSEHNLRRLAAALKSAESGPKGEFSRPFLLPRNASS